MNSRYRLNHSIANTSIFFVFLRRLWILCSPNSCYALKQGLQSIAMLEKLQKCSYRLLWKIEVVPFAYLSVVDKHYSFIILRLRMLSYILSDLEKSRLF